MNTENEGVFPLSTLYYNEIQHKNKIYLRQPIDGVFHEYTWGEVMNKARRIATFLKELGLQRGDHVSIFSKNCAEWIITDFGIMLAGMVNVPLYATQHKDDINYILEHSEAKAIFIGKLEHYEEQVAGIPDNILRINFPYDDRSESTFKLNDIFNDYEPMRGEFLPENLDDIFTILYTSGTTGDPKGVVYSYKTVDNYMKYFNKDFEQFNLSGDGHLISYLPLAHSVERMMIEMLSIQKSFDMSFVESIDTFTDNIRDISPTIFFGSPRIWSVFQTKILEKLPQQKLNTLLQVPLVSWLIKNKIKKALGLSRSQLNISSAAPIPRSTLEWFHKMGIDIIEAYGSTENATYATANLPGEIRFGSTGQPRIGVEIIVDKNSELLIKSPGDMVGYYKEPELTKEVMTDNGFIHTGDMGHMDENGYVFVIGRLKDQFKTAKGEFITPTPIEHAFAKNKNIDQCCLIGLGLKQPILVAHLSEAAQKDNKSNVAQELLATLEEVDKNLGTFEKISHILIVDDEWTPENNLLTSTQKIKRHAVQEKYGRAANDVQNKSVKIVWEKTA